MGYALEHREEALNYAMQFARDMETEVADQFVGMYVNKWTLGYGEQGRKAVREFLDRGAKAGLVPAQAKSILLLVEQNRQRRKHSAILRSVASSARTIHPSTIRGLFAVTMRRLL